MIAPAPLGWRDGGTLRRDPGLVNFADRVDAGRHLADVVRTEAPEDALILGLPRGGVIVARQVATALGLPIDFVGVRKIGAPGHPEFAVGAIAEGGARAQDVESCRRLGISSRDWDEVERAEQQELARRVRVYRAGRRDPDLLGRSVVIVDDGMATGATALAACRSVRARGAERIVVAVPVAPAEWRLGPLAHEADALVAVWEPEDLLAVGRFYRDFAPTTDEQVLDALVPDDGTPEPPEAQRP